MFNLSYSNRSLGIVVNVITISVECLGFNSCAGQSRPNVVNDSARYDSSLRLKCVAQARTRGANVAICYTLLRETASTGIIKI